MRTDDLLRRSQEMAQTLQTQQEELRETNEQLQVKARQLTAQRDEVERKGLVAPRDLDRMSGADLAALGPPGADGLLFVSITRADRGYTFGGEDYSVTLSGVVVNPDARRVVWRDSGSGNTSLGGFLRIFAPRSPAYDAIYQALQNLFRDVPKRRT